MRTALSISLPKSEKISIENEARRRGISLSAYILHAVKMDRVLITEEDVLEIEQRSDESFKT
jgi:hypothetical protein